MRFYTYLNEAEFNPEYYNKMEKLVRKGEYSLSQLKIKLENAMRNHDDYKVLVLQRLIKEKENMNSKIGK